jgi:hypothetical protein
MGDYQSDREISDLYIPEIKAAVGSFLVDVAPDVEDTQRNTDLIVLKMDAKRVACRVRSQKYLDLYPDEFTIRTSRPSGVKTELTKLIQGFGDYIFYGFGDGHGTLLKWKIGDLSVFRLWFMRHLQIAGGKVPGFENSNKDNSSGFRAFKWDEVAIREGEPFVVADSETATKPAIH